MENDRCIIIDCKYGSGGYGDRIVGMLSIFTVANLLNRKFLIKWESPNISDSITINPEYDYHQFEDILKGKSIKNYHIMNKSGKMGFLRNIDLEKYFPEDVSIVQINNEWVKELQFNPLYKDKINYLETIDEFYKDFYGKIFIPTKNIVDEIQILNIDYNNTLGIQIRTGDQGMTKSGATLLLKNMNIVCKDIVDHINILFPNNPIFLTCDNSEIYTIFKELCKDREIIYNDKPILHLDKNKVNSGLEKVFVDNIILSNLKYLLISLHSNFGRIAAMMSKSEVLHSINARGIIDVHECKSKISSKC